MSLITTASLDSFTNEYFSTVTISDNAVFSSVCDSFDSGSATAITMSSSAASSLTMGAVYSTNNPAISGAGVGTLTLGNITFLSNSTISGTLTTSYVTTGFGNLVTTGNLEFQSSGNKITSASVGTTVTAGANSIGSVTLAGGTATVSTTSVTTDSLIYIWRQSVGSTGIAATGIYL